MLGRQYPQTEEGDNAMDLTDRGVGVFYGMGADVGGAGQARIHRRGSAEREDNDTLFAL
jgi:hypothetical protein